MGKIVQIRLPVKEVELIDSLVKQKWFTSRSDFIQKAVTSYIPTALSNVENETEEAVA